MRFLGRSLGSSLFIVLWCVLLRGLSSRKVVDFGFGLEGSMIRVWDEKPGTDLSKHCEGLTKLGMEEDNGRMCTALKDCEEIEGEVRYLRLHFCALRGMRVVSTLLLTIWLAGLIYVMVWVAEDYLCPSLAGIADSLQLSPDVAGVTFLALGNGSPDIRYDHASGFFLQGELRHAPRDKSLTFIEKKVVCSNSPLLSKLATGNFSTRTKMISPLIVEHTLTL